MSKITIEAKPSVTGTAKSYRVTRNQATYYMTEDISNGSVYVSQCYVSRLGRRGERRLQDGKVRDELLSALAGYKDAARDLPPA